MSPMRLIVFRPTRMWVLLLIWLGPYLGAPADALAAQYSGEQLYKLVGPSGVTFSGYSLPAHRAAEGQVTADGMGAGNSGHALLWDSSGTAIDLNAAGSPFTAASAYATDGVNQVGAGSGTSTGGQTHAILWSGTSASAIDLQPTNLSGFTLSYAVAVSGSQQAGYADGPAGNDAMIWSGTANSAIDLTPTDLSGFTATNVSGTDGTQQVGAGGGTGTGNHTHALLWNGTANSAVDLAPAGFTNSYANGTDGVHQVGYANGPTSGNLDHAMFWSGTAASAIDLNPTNLSGFVKSYALDIADNHEVGYAYPSSNLPHAILWSGTANSAVDLQSLLPSGVIQSYALTIDGQGDIFGVASYSGGTYAVEWSPVPEPSSLVLSLFGSVGLAVLAWRRASLSGKPCGL